MKIISSVTDRKMWFLWCDDLVCNWLHLNKHSRHILGVHANMITAVIEHNVLATETFGVHVILLCLG